MPIRRSSFTTRLFACLLIGWSVLCADTAQAGTWTVLLADDTPSHLEFVRTLRKQPDPRQILRIQRISSVSEDASAFSDEQDMALPNVHTRSLGAALPSGAVTMAVGAAAARAALKRPGNEPLLLTLLSRLDYEDLHDLLAAARARGRRISVQLRDPALAEQLRLISALLPTQRRLGVIVADPADPVLQELRDAATGWQIEVETAPDAKTLSTALRALLMRSDMLLILPNAIGNSSAAALTIVQAANDAGKAVFGTTEAMVRSGALATVVSSPAQLSQQARAMAEVLASAAEGKQPPELTVAAARPTAAHLNQAAATRLHMALPSEDLLSQKLGLSCDERTPASPCSRPLPGERRAPP